MNTPPYQTVRLARGRHASSHAGVCVMELASMLAHEPFSDRPRSISPTLGAFLRTYNDGLDDHRRQDLYPVAAALVGTAARRAVERERVNRCLEFARQQGAHLPARRAALSLATPEAAGGWAARSALEAGAHEEALSLVGELVTLSGRPSPWPTSPILHARSLSASKPLTAPRDPRGHRIRLTDRGSFGAVVPGHRGRASHSSPDLADSPRVLRGCARAIAKGVGRMSDRVSRRS